jgi:hypothetical protein
MEERPRKLLDQVRDTIRLKHYSYRTEQSYIHWIRRFILFHNKRHLTDMSRNELEAVLLHIEAIQLILQTTKLLLRGCRES